MHAVLALACMTLALTPYDTVFEKYRAALQLVNLHTHDTPFGTWPTIDRADHPDHPDLKFDLTPINARYDDFVFQVIHAYLHAYTPTFTE
jgi:hypothetical protein